VCQGCMPTLIFVRGTLCARVLLSTEYSFLLYLGRLIASKSSTKWSLRREAMCLEICVLRGLCACFEAVCLRSFVFWKAVCRKRDAVWPNA
jgi:hypothetical protein